MTINKLVFDLDSFNLIEKNITQPLVVGQHDFYKFEFEFRQNNEVINNPLWAVRVLFERPDGEGSNELSVLLNNGKYEKKLSSWVSDIAGDLKISVLVNNMAFTQVLLPVRAGLTPSGDTITDMQYQALLNDIRGLNLNVSSFLITNEFDSKINIDLVNGYDFTYLIPVDEANIIIPHDAKHGYFCGLNFKAFSDFDINIANDSNFNYKIIRFGEVWDKISCVAGKTYNVIIYCDGLNIRLYYYEL